jgi:hypothetical protein
MTPLITLIEVHVSTILKAMNNYELPLGLKLVLPLLPKISPPF